MGELFIALFLGLLAPLWLVFHYITKWKTSKGLSSEDEKLLEELYQSAQRMESRISALETILDDRTERWREDRSDRQRPRS